MIVKEDRVWGCFHVLNEGRGYKIKTLFIYPKCGISYQRHTHRTEIWLIENGTGILRFEDHTATAKEGDVITIKPNEWHQIYNNNEKEVLRVHEIQYGELCDETDIERWDA